MTHIALVGGTFDPPHLGHQALVASALALTGAQETWVLVNGSPPHRDAPSGTIDERLRLAHLAFDHLPAVSLLSLESDPKVAHFTVDTLRQLRKLYPAYRFSWLLGADEAARFPAWRDPARILDLATLVIVPRAGYPTPSPAFFQAAGLDLTRINFAQDLTLPAISASAVRTSFRLGHIPPYSLAPSVKKALLGIPNYLPGRNLTVPPSLVLPPDPVPIHL